MVLCDIACNYGQAACNFAQGISGHDMDCSGAYGRCLHDCNDLIDNKIIQGACDVIVNSEMTRAVKYCGTQVGIEGICGGFCSTSTAELSAAIIAAYGGPEDPIGDRAAARAAVDMSLNCYLGCVDTLGPVCAAVAVDPYYVTSSVMWATATQFCWRVIGDGGGSPPPDPDPLPDCAQDLAPPEDSINKKCCAGWRECDAATYYRSPGQTGTTCVDEKQPCATQGTCAGFLEDKREDRPCCPGFFEYTMGDTVRCVPFQPLAPKEQDCTLAYQDPQGKDCCAFQKKCGPDIYASGQTTPGYLCAPGQMDCADLKSCTPYFGTPTETKKCCPGMYPHTSDGVEYCTFDPLCKFTDGTGFDGGGYNADSTSANDCCNKCSNDPKCAAASYVAKDKKCYIKTDNVQATDCVDCVGICPSTRSCPKKST